MFRLENAGAATNYLYLVTYCRIQRFETGLHSHQQRLTFFPHFFRS